MKKSTFNKYAVIEWILRGFLFGLGLIIAMLTFVLLNNLVKAIWQ